jgi:hypothetical protein
MKFFYLLAATFFISSITSNAQYVKAKPGLINMPYQNYLWAV